MLTWSFKVQCENTIHVVRILPVQHARTTSCIIVTLGVAVNIRIRINPASAHTAHAPSKQSKEARTDMHRFAKKLFSVRNTDWSDMILGPTADDAIP